MAAGRTVVMTSITGTLWSVAAGNCAGSVKRAAQGPGCRRHLLVKMRFLSEDAGFPPREGAVLAVDETLLHGPIKAGYHGGAATSTMIRAMHAADQAKTGGRPDEYRAAVAAFGKP